VKVQIPVAGKRKLAIKLGILESIKDQYNSFILILYLNTVCGLQMSASTQKATICKLRPKNSDTVEN
jgi:hypothetical protein